MTPMLHAEAAIDPFEPARLEIVSATVEQFIALEPIMQAHWRELAVHKAVMVLAPDYDTYRELEAAQRLIALVAKIDGLPVGYCVSYMATSMHYRDLLMCQNDVIFLLDAKRGERVGAALMARTEIIAASMGARLALWHAKPQTVLSDALASHGRYHVQDIIFSREL